MSVVRSPLVRAVVLDGGVVALAGVIIGFGSQQAAPFTGGTRALDPWAFALMAAAVIALAARRRWPLATLAVTVALSVAYLAAGYPVGPLFLAPAIAMYSLAVRWPVRRSLVALAVSLLALLAGHTPAYLDAGRSALLAQLADGAPWAAGWLGLPWAIGTLLRLGREQAGRDREEEARRRAYEERLRVARDVHDVVGHGLAVINMQAGVALHVLGKRPDQAQVALDAIKTTSKDALEELRATLTVFRRPDGSDAPRRPMPGLDQLESLTTEMTDSGLPVQLLVSGERTRLPGAVDLAAYRIVQESLTNALRHAGPATATVRVTYGPDTVDLEITDDGHGRGPRADGHGGHGLAGMRERAAAVGGTLEAGARQGGGFRVHARLPSGEDRP
ncbi:MAG TPA: sensor histidine kinase [Actinomycetes bacterium]|jgi:signal transduction histidine kinase|nr:sensor histidine kinase [Actinomycetes bacterium]